MSSRIMGIALKLVFLIVFNIAFFVLGGNHGNISVWISYGFIHFSFLMLIITPILNKKNEKNAVLGLSIYAISSSYFIFELIVGIVFFIINMESYKLGLVIQVVLAGIYFTLLLSHLIANNTTINNIQNHERELRYVKESTARLNTLIGVVSDQKTKKNIEKLYDLIHSSQVKSDNSVRNMENDIMDRIRQIEGAVSRDDMDMVNNICNDTISIVEMRNSILKHNN